MSATLERHWPEEMRRRFLLLLSFVLLVTAAFANEAVCTDWTLVESHVERLVKTPQQLVKLVFVMTVVPTTQQVSGNSNSSAIKRHRATRFVVDFTQVLPLVSLLHDWVT
ncbi:hypothetical protein LSAT2_032179 [Lamellibrachia satsuma]|nr:hypothetical protein LSAT2_032179 [Lamellibrachia satsuma]